MHSSIVASVSVLAFVASHAMAACPTGALTNAGIKTALAGAAGASKYHCAIRGSEKWNESLGNTNTGNNADNGTVTDYKKGAGDPVDPTGTVGTWTIANDTITYNYGPGAIFTYSVTGTGPYTFCDVGTSATLVVSVSTSPTASPTSCP
jgi:hypothetical protein